MNFPHYAFPKGKARVPDQSYWHSTPMCCCQCFLKGFCLSGQFSYTLFTETEVWLYLSCCHTDSKVPSFPSWASFSQCRNLNNDSKDLLTTRPHVPSAKSRVTFSSSAPLCIFLCILWFSSLPQCHTQSTVSNPDAVGTQLMRTSLNVLLLLCSCSRQTETLAWFVSPTASHKQTNWETIGSIFFS